MDEKSSDSLDLASMGIEKLTASSKAGKLLMERTMTNQLVELNLSGNALSQVPGLLLEAW